MAPRGYRPPAPASQNVTIDNTTSDPLLFRMAVDQSWITSSVSSGTTPAVVQLGINPSGLTEGTYSGTVIVTTSDVTSFPLSIPVTLTVEAPGTAMLTSNRSSLNFGNVDIGSDSTLPVALTNSGNANVTIANISISGPGFRASGIPTGQLLSPGQSASLHVTLAPAATGSVTGSVIVTSNATNSPATISLSGAGTQPLVSYAVQLTWAPNQSPVVGYNIYRSLLQVGGVHKAEFCDRFGVNVHGYRRRGRAVLLLRCDGGEFEQCRERILKRSAGYHSDILKSQS